MIAVMDRLEIVCLRPVLEELTDFLHQKGLVQIEEMPLAMASAPGFLHRVHLTPAQKAEAAELEEIDRALKEILPLLHSSADREAVAAATKSLAGHTRAEWAVQVRHLAQDIRALTRKKLGIADNLEILRNYDQLLRQIEPLLGAREVSFGRDARAIVLKGDVTKAVERLEERLNALIGQNDYEFIQRKTSRSTLVGVLKYNESKNETIGRILREQGIDPVDVPEKDAKLGATPRAILERIEKTIAREVAELAEVQSEIEKFSTSNVAALTAYATLVSDDLAKVRALGDFAQSKMLGVVRGWSPQESTPDLKAKLEAKFPGKVAVSILDPEEVPAEQVPTLLKNPGWLKPFEVLLALYKPPTYGTYDPTLFVAIAFIFFYGFILGDMGYGLCLIGFSALLKKKWGHNEIVASASVVAKWMGISSIFFGFIYMEAFGDIPARFGVPALFHRGHEATTLMLVAIAIGAVHVILSLLLGVREGFAHHHEAHAWEKIGMLIGLVAVGIFAFNYFQVPVFTMAIFPYISIAMLLVFVVIMFKAAGPMMGAVLVLELVSLIGNVLSYCRLMALGISGMVLADLANQAGTAMNPVIGFPLAIAIHFFALCLGIFSPALHSLRLNYVESMPKYYSPNGKYFSPFRKEATW